MGDGSSEWVMALHVLCQGALVGGVIGALGAVKPVQVLQVRSYVRPLLCTQSCVPCI